MLLFAYVQMCFGINTMLVLLDVTSVCVILLYLVLREYKHDVAVAACNASVCDCGVYVSVNTISMLLSGMSAV